MVKPVWNNAHRVNHQNFAKKTHPCAKKNMVPRAVLMKSGLVSINTARQNISKTAILVNTTRQGDAAHSKTTVNAARSMGKNLNTARPKAVVNAVKRNNFNIQVSDGLVPQKKLIFLPNVQGNPQMDLQDQRVIDSACSRHMTGNMSYITDYEEIDGGYVAFGGNPKGEKITGKCTIKTGNLDFENVYFVRELMFNLFSVLQMCDKKNNVLFNDIECIILSLNFKLIDESQVLLRVPGKNNMYSVDLKNIIPKGVLTCLSAKATSDESKIWHKRLGHLNFKTMNKLVKGNLVREAVNTACYVQNRVLVVKPHNKTPYKLVHGRTQTLSFMRLFECHVTILNTIDHLDKFDGKADEGSGPDWLFDIDALTRTMNYEPIVADPKSSHDDGSKPLSDDRNKVDEDPRKENECNNQEKEDNVNSTSNVNNVSITVNTTGTNRVNVVSRIIRSELSFDPNMPALEDVGIFDFSRDDEDDDAVADMNNLDTTIQIEEEVYVCQPIRFEDTDFPDRVYKVEKALYGLHQAPRAWFTEVKTASRPMETQKPLLKDEDGKEVDVHMYRSMIGSLMNLTSSRPDIMFAVCACARYQVNPKKLNIWLLQVAMDKCFGFRINYLIMVLVYCYGQNYQWEARLHAKVDGKKIIVTESFVRRDLRLADEKDEAVHKELGNRLVRVATTASSLEAEQDSGNITKSQSKAIPNEPSSQGTDSDCGSRCQETMGDTTAQTRFESVSKHSNDSLLASGNTLRSDEDRLKLDELMALCTTFQNKVLDLEKTTTTQRNEIASLKR
nr:ribonuclease H-like domain-containing protein [Tanacetum cinerariifolium]